MNIKSDKIVSFSVDTVAKAVYIQYTNEPVDHTKRLDKSVNIDYDKNKNIVGLEVLGVKSGQTTIKQFIRKTENGFNKQVRKDIAPFLEPVLNH